MRYQSKDLVLAAAFGWLSGMRSMAGPAIAGRKLLRNDHLKDLLALGAAGEVLVDKHPATPNRNAREPLAARTIMGAATGAAIVLSGAGWRPGSPVRTRRYRFPMTETDALQAAAVGAIIGGASAFISTHVTYHMRRIVAERTGAPSAAVGAVEDVVVYGTGILLADTIE